MSLKKARAFSRTREGRRFDARERLIFDITEDLCRIMEDKGVSKSELARRTGVSQAYITKILRDGSSFTLGKVSDLFFALGYEVIIYVRHISR